METLSWATFKSNVEQWAESRGIYEQSTEAKQIKKFLEEAGEAVVSLDENDYEQLADDIGDMAVCIVNAAKLGQSPHSAPDQNAPALDDIGSAISFVVDKDYDVALGVLMDIAKSYDLEFGRCLAKAWGEIEHRRGLMIDGLFVKWENLTKEQRAECAKRGQ